jgi:integrating conjugative element protein (TIGR03757 family)
MRAGLAILIAAAACRVGAEPAVEVFTDSKAFAVTGAEAFGATLYDLAGLRRWAAALRRTLPTDPAGADAGARAALATAAGPAAQVLAGLAKAADYRLAKVPAIVLGHGEAVVYGITDVREAVDLYRRWKEGA